MKIIITVKDQDINSDASIVDSSSFRNREAARAVVIDDEYKVALLKVGLHHYHKLPGGGIDPGEDIQSALERELLEEIGCEAEVELELGKTIEQRDKFEMHQTSYCYTAAKVGESKKPDYTEKELREQFSIVWAENLDHAVQLLEADVPQNYEGKFIQKRDLAILYAAQDAINGYTPTEKDIDWAVEYLKTKDPMMATSENAISMLEDIQLSFDDLEKLDSNKLDDFYKKLNT